MATRWGGALQAGVTFVAGLFGDYVGRTRGPWSPHGWAEPYYGAIGAAAFAALTYAAMWDVANRRGDRPTDPGPTPPAP